MSEFGGCGRRPHTRGTRVGEAELGRRNEGGVVWSRRVRLWCELVNELGVGGWWGGAQRGAVGGEREKRAERVRACVNVCGAECGWSGRMHGRWKGVSVLSEVGWGK